MKYMVNHVFMVKKCDEIHGELCGKEMICQTSHYCKFIELDGIKSNVLYVFESALILK